MTFSVDGLTLAIDSSFSQGGLDDLGKFIVARHLDTRRWIIASDFNIGSTGSAQDVYAFACYPIDKQGHEHLVNRLAQVMPADFKHTKIIARSLKHFFTDNECFCLVFMLPKRRMAFREHAEHVSNLGVARRQIEEAMTFCSSAPHIPEFHRSAIHRVLIESKKKNFSLDLFEHILNFCVMLAFISRTLSVTSNAATIGWVSRPR